MSQKKALLLSSSNFHGYKLLEYVKDELTSFLEGNNVSKILFIPYALFDFDKYTEEVKVPFNKFGFKVEGIHQFNNPEKAINSAEAIYIGGGNTFKLLKTLYENNLIDLIKKRVENGVPYIGASAGTIVATYSINTTNDMPIVYPPTLKAIGLVPFNINAHYLDPDPESKHKGETRELRIQQYHQIADSPPVVGLREGSFLHLDGDKLVLKGFTPARLFIRGKEPVEYPVNSDMGFLLTS